MEINIAPITLFLTLILAFSVPLIYGNNQKESLSKFYKLKKNSGIDKSPFNGTHHHHHHHHEVEVHSQQGLKEKDRIERLPGQPPVRFNQYGGYVTVDKTAGRAFYYYFVESQKPEKSKSLPLLLWLNGGPGCSSLAYGAMQELGPFLVYSDGKTLYKNKFAWNYAANVLFLESPAGVGFSYSNSTNDSKRGGDERTAIDNYAFLLNWLERFPEYKNREFYISGESYAGHYVPQLAHKILYHNRKAKKTIINLKGIIMGNAVLNDETDEKGMYEYFATHALISDETYATISKYCDFSPNSTTEPTQCAEALTEADTNVKDLDIYNIYAPLCLDNKITNKPKKPTSGLDPCGDYYVYAYMNRVEVQKALHANVTKLPYDWQPCGHIQWQDSPSTVLPLIKEFLANGIRVWIFSGDIDGRIPVTSTKNSIKNMKLPIKTSWHPWYLGGEIGGYTQVYEGNLTFATVRGAGHEVPGYQPARALSLIMHFLGGTELPNSSNN